MSADAQNFIDSFNALPESARYEAAVEILRSTSQWDLGPVSDETLSLAAEELFLELDQREAADGA